MVNSSCRQSLPLEDGSVGVGVGVWYLTGLPLCVPQRPRLASGNGRNT